jgi:predicted nucleotidyltransferase
MSAHDPETHESVLSAMLAVAGVLEAEGSRYALIGALAAAQHGVIRATQDADFLVTVPPLRLPALLERLRESGCTIEMARVMREWTSEHLAQFHYHDVPIDWIEPVIPLFQKVLERAAARDVLGHRVRVADAEGTILMKLAAFRPEDRRDVEALASVCRGVDWNFVRAQLATVFGPEDQRLVWLASHANDGHGQPARDT